MKVMELTYLMPLLSQLKDTKKMQLSFRIIKKMWFIKIIQMEV